MNNANAAEHAPTIHTPADPPELTVIGPDTTIKGEMFFEKSARILGTFEGRITAQGEVQIGQSAHCAAAVEAQRVVVDGSVTGPIHAHERLTLTANAQVRGDITAGTLVVAEGASFVGQCSVGPRAQELEQNAETARDPRAEQRADHRPEQRPEQQRPAARTTEVKAQIANPVELTPPWANQTRAQPAGAAA